MKVFVDGLNQFLCIIKQTGVNMITAAQLWYICTVYPESVTHEEVVKDFEDYVQREDHKQKYDKNGIPIEHWREEESVRFLWQVRADIINKQ